MLNTNELNDIVEDISNDLENIKDNEVSIEEKVKQYIQQHNPKLMIITISSDNKVSCNYNQSMISLATNFTKLNIPFDIVSLKNETDFNRGKNSLIARFLSNEDYTHLMFIDKNLTFSWFSVLNLILEDHNISGSVPPNEHINWNKLIDIYKNKDNNNNKDNNQSQSPEILLAKSYTYNFTPYIKNNDNKELENELEIKNNFLRVNSLTSAFLMIKRNVFDTLIEKYPTIRYQNTLNQYNSENTKIQDCFFTFFEQTKNLTTNILMDGNQTFFKRWTDIDGEIWLDLNTNINITSDFEYKGSLLLSLQNN